MIKLIGCLCILAAGGLFGASKAAGYAHRPQELRSLQAALSLLETEIIYGATPLPEALHQVAQRVNPIIATLFVTAGDDLRSQDGTSVYEAWQRALYQLQDKSHLRSSDISVLANLGSVLGASDRNDQAKHLKLAIERLGVQAAEAEEQARKNVKLWQYLGFFAGAAVVLLLI
ncbi:MAG: stage III sporulation protein AB [Peptococcaceae bacterium]|nr:stage III sporulation protein AB [Peptococcaceae bacterium]